MFSLKLKPKSAKFNEGLKPGFEIVRKLWNLFLKKRNGNFISHYISHGKFDKKRSGNEKTGKQGGAEGKGDGKIRRMGLSPPCPKFLAALEATVQSVNTAVRTCLSQDAPGAPTAPRGIRLRFLPTVVRPFPRHAARFRYVIRAGTSQ